MSAPEHFEETQSTPVRPANLESFQSTGLTGDTTLEDEFGGMEITSSKNNVQATLDESSVRMLAAEDNRIQLCGCRRAEAIASGTITAEEADAMPGEWNITSEELREFEMELRGGRMKRCDSPSSIVSLTPGQKECLSIREMIREYCAECERWMEEERLKHEEQMKNEENQDGNQMDTEVNGTH
ncbi:hypothetical protein DFH28DRAFT_924631 [Melampsora americana]|nr:hypothetical protein DFH28DRAFT_924631 [Melampsora americana]